MVNPVDSLGSRVRRAESGTRRGLGARGLHAPDADAAQESGSVQAHGERRVLGTARAVRHGARPRRPADVVRFVGVVAGLEPSLAGLERSSAAPRLRRPRRSASPRDKQSPERWICPRRRAPSAWRFATRRDRRSARSSSARSRRGSCRSRGTGATDDGTAAPAGRYTLRRHVLLGDRVGRRRHAASVRRSTAS